MENSKRFVVQFSEAAKSHFAQSATGKKNLIREIAYQCRAAFLSMGPASWIPVTIEFSLDRSVKYDLNEKELKLIFQISQDALDIRKQQANPWRQKTDEDYIKDRLNAFFSIDQRHSIPVTYVTHVTPV
jgi:hypothetical protein